MKAIDKDIAQDSKIADELPESLKHLIKTVPSHHSEVVEKAKEEQDGLLDTVMDKMELDKGKLKQYWDKLQEINNQTEQKEVAENYTELA